MTSGYKSVVVWLERMHVLRLPLRSKMAFLHDFSFNIGPEVHVHDDIDAVTVLWLLKSLPYRLRLNKVHIHVLRLVLPVPTLRSGAVDILPSAF